ncbi:family 78 glycoside hydrolase catalytic domain [Oleiharenicola sp. Vm1]|uniref:family 78 glycoside hydrolase catalytic domain n=1 Tax=Oleiharenicola sp. Vm1 TaxID=3398393 RepID=UPI0039F55ED6
MITSARPFPWLRCSLGLLVLLAASAARLCGAPLEVYDLRCDVAENPLGIDSSPPRLAWKLRGTGTDERQTAWQVLVASASELLAQDRGDVWDSGRQTGDAQLNVPFAGRPLRSSEQVFWKVRAWNGDGVPSAWSAPATWTMGVLTPDDWRARWISDAELLRWVRPKVGFHSQATPDEHAKKWIVVDLGAAKPISTVRVYPVRQTIEEGQGMPLRFVIEASESADFARATVIADHTRKPFSWATTKEKTTVPTFNVPGGPVTARYVRMTTQQLRRDGDVSYFALSQIEIIADGKNVAPGSRVSASDSLEEGRWSLASVVDGLEVRGANPRDNATLLARREFAVKPALRRALVHVSGLGHYELSINGHRVGQDLFSPGWTTYEKVVLYDTHDVTALVRAGGNAIGVTLGGGMFNVRAGRYVKLESRFRPLMVIAQLRLEYADGSVEFVGTDEQWQVRPGPITFSNMYGGEDYDARLEPTGWDRPGYAAQDWARAAVTPGPGGELRGASHAPPPVRTFDVLAPASVRALRPGVTVYDLGQNVSLMPRLRVRGPAGSVVRIIPAELLGKDGAVDRGSCSRGTGEAWWQYTLAGRPEGEEWFPKFFYHGSRYLQVEVAAADGAATLPVVDSLVGVVVHTSSPPAGDFACSNELFNRVRTLVRWAQRSNLMSVITDCPHRERLGWLEQYHLNGPALRYEFDLTRLYAKTFDDMEAAQTADGLVPDIAPEYVIFSQGFRDSPEWGSALILAAWQHYQFTGDERPLRRHYAAMCRYVDYLRSKSADRLLSHGLGDWYDIGPKGPGRSQLTPIPLTATATYFEDLKTLAAIAILLGKPADAQKFTAEAAEVKGAFNRAFFHADRGSYATDSQCGNAMPLVFDLVEPAARPRVVDALVRDIQARGLTAGDVGYRYLLRALAEGGRSDVIYALNNQSEKPGYGYQLAHGATSLTEAWNAGRGSSQNHFMLGQITEWFYHDLAGIQPDPAGPGFQKIVIRPAIVGDLTWVKASYQSPRGPIAVAWKRDGRAVTLDVTVPVNATATVHVPGEAAPRTVGSGTHHFTGSVP